MIVIVAFAVLGAVLGLYAKPRWLGVAIALALVVGVEGGARFFISLIHDQPNRELLIDRLQAVFGETWLDAVAPIVVTVIAAVLAAIMGGVMDRDGKTVVVDAERIHRKVGKNGRYARMEGMIEERPAQSAAESRFDSILGL